MVEFPKAYLLIENADGTELKFKGKPVEFRNDPAGVTITVFVPGMQLANLSDLPAEGEYEILGPQALKPGQKSIGGQSG